MRFGIRSPGRCDFKKLLTVSDACRQHERETGGTIVSLTNELPQSLPRVSTLQARKTWKLFLKPSLMSEDRSKVIAELMAQAEAELWCGGDHEYVFCREALD